MSISTYAELQSAASNWLNRSGLSDRIPEFIELAEAKFNRMVRAPEMLTRDDSFTVDGQYEDAPAGFLELKRAYLDTSPPTPLEYLTPEEMQQKRMKMSGAGKPVYVSVTGGEFEFLKSPDQGYTASLLYYEATAALSDTNTTNWLLTSHPDIYLFGTLLEAEPYLRNDERVALWSSRLQTALDQLDVHNQNKALVGTPVARAKSFG